MNIVEPFETRMLYIMCAVWQFLTNEEHLFVNIENPATVSKIREFPVISLKNPLSELLKKNGLKKSSEFKLM